MYNSRMAKRVIHISEEEAANEFASLVARVRAGVEVIIESGAQPVAILHPADPRFACCLSLSVSPESTALRQLWMEILPRMWKPPSRVIVNPSTHPNGTNPGFQCRDRGRTSRRNG
jgi:antitoxin (DNA-binding transcriptional repressor) of toxin-antitoxin stability system